MDYYSKSTPVAKRTRLRTTEYFKEMHAEIQRSKRASSSSSVNNTKDNGTDGGASSSRGTRDNNGTEGGVGRSTSAATSTGGKGGEKDDVQVINEPRLGKRKGQIVLGDTYEEEEDEDEIRRNGLKRQKNDYERIEGDQSFFEDDDDGEEIEELTNQVINKIVVRSGYGKDFDDGVAGPKKWNTNDSIQVKWKQNFIDLEEDGEEEIRAEKRYKRKRAKSLAKYEAEEEKEELLNQVNN